MTDSPDADAPRLVFRVRREDEEGETITEERELTGCTTRELMEYLSAPWESVPARDPDASGDAVDALAEAIVDAVTELELVVERRAAETGPRATVVGIRRARHSDDAEPPSRPSPHTPDDEADRAAGTVQVHVRGDVGDEDVVHEDAHSRIDVHNEGLMVMNRGNVYANVQLHLHVTIDEA